MGGESGEGDLSDGGGSRQSITLTPQRLSRRERHAKPEATLHTPLKLGSVIRGLEEVWISPRSLDPNSLHPSATLGWVWDRAERRGQRSTCSRDCPPLPSAPSFQLLPGLGLRL